MKFESLVFEANNSARRSPCCSVVELALPMMAPIRYKLGQGKRSGKRVLSDPVRFGEPDQLFYLMRQCGDVGWVFSGARSRFAPDDAGAAAAPASLTSDLLNAPLVSCISRKNRLAGRIASG
jgi:hypothetical protein